MRDRTDERIYMPPARLMLVPNGPYRITGELELVDFDGHAHTGSKEDK